MTLVVLDTAGRLVRFEAVPPQKDAAAATTTPDWSALFRLAALDQSTFHPVSPEWLPRGAADAREAWEGSIPGGPANVRVEAAAWHGKAIYFQIVAPWTRPGRMEENGLSRRTQVLNLFTVAAIVALLLSALFVCRANVRAGRGDWNGAIRLGTVAIVGQLVTWALNDPHVGNPLQELNRFFDSIGEALFAGGLLVVMHLAVEPAVRRYWPHGVLGWTRLLQGRFRDARVGHDVLAGIAAGAALQLLITARDPLQGMLGAHYPVAAFGNLRYFEGPRYVVGYLSSEMAFQAVFTAMACIFSIVGLKRVLKRLGLVWIAATLLLAFIIGRDLFVDARGILWINVAVALLMVGTIATLAVRMGLLATAACFFVSTAIGATPWTFDTSAWYFTPAAVAFGVVAALALFASYAARTQEPSPAMSYVLRPAERRGKS
jgi:hypothetical protein